ARPLAAGGAGRHPHRLRDRGGQLNTPAWKKRLLWLLGLALFLLLLAWIWHGSWQRQAVERERRARQRLLVYRAALESEIARFETIPRALRSHPVLSQALQWPADPHAIARANRLLAQLAAETGVEALYLIDAHGFTLAASNWN